MALFRPRVWHIGRPAPEAAALARAVQVIRSAKRPLVVAGGGVVYADGSEQLRAFATATGIPVADTHAGKGAINWDHPSAVGGIGSTGTSAANALARQADVVIGIGTRYSDFTLSLIHISEPTRLLSNSYAVFRLKKKTCAEADTYEITIGSAHSIDFYY